MSKLTDYFKETRAELKHVIWPTKSQATFYTITVIILSLLVAYILGFFDFAFLQGLEKLISF